jgi:CRP-like cAMP-binding protein
MHDGSARVLITHSKSAPGSENYLLAALPPEDYSRLVPHLVETTLDSGERLQEPEQPIQRIYFPIAGAISLLAPLPDGHAIYAAMIGREGALGSSAGLGSQRAFNRAVVHAPLSASCITQPRFADAAAASAAIRAMIGRYSNLLLAQVQQTLLCNTFHHLQSRVCRWLLHARDGMPTDTIELTQQYLSSVLGARRTSINMVIGALQAEGIVEVRRGRIVIRDREQLKRKTCSCYEIVQGLTAAQNETSLQPASPSEEAAPASFAGG